MMKSATFLMLPFLSTLCGSMQTPSTQKGAAARPASKKWSCPLGLRLDYGMTDQNDIRFRLRMPATDNPLPTARSFSCNNLEITDESGKPLSLRSLSLGQHKDGLSISGSVRAQAPYPTHVRVSCDVAIELARDGYEDVNNNVHVEFTLVWEAAESTWRPDKNTQPIVRNLNPDPTAP